MKGLKKISMETFVDRAVKTVLRSKAARFEIREPLSPNKFAALMNNRGFATQVRGDEVVVAIIH